MGQETNVDKPQACRYTVDEKLEVSSFLYSDNKNWWNKNSNWGGLSDLYK